MNEIGLLPIFLIRSQDKKYMRLTLQPPKKAGDYELRRRTLRVRGSPFPVSFKRLARLAADMLRSGDSVVVDAACTARWQRELIAQVMLSCNSVQTKAASRLGINRNTLHKKLKEYGLDGEA